MAQLDISTKIRLTDSPASACNKLARGNVAAFDALLDCVAVNAEYDPNAALGSYTMLIHAENYGYHGDKLASLYKSCCDSPKKMITLFRAMQLGIIQKDFVDTAFSGFDLRGKSFHDALLVLVQTRVPCFGR